MSRRISSSLTAVAPYLAVVLYIPVIGLFVVMYDISSPLWWFMVSSFVIGNIVSLLLCPFPKVIDIHDDKITVTSLLRRSSVSLPFTAITEIRPAWFTQHVSLILNIDTRFGRKITFIPRIKLFHPFLGHPDIQALKDAVLNAKTTAAQ